MTIKSIWLRKIHKWIGLFVGLQFLLWAVSGAAMALLDMGQVAGGPTREVRQAPLASTANAWPSISAQIGEAKIESIRVRPLIDQALVEVKTSGSTKLFDGRTGEPFAVDAEIGAAVAKAAHPQGLQPSEVKLVKDRTIPVREHEPPFWKVDFADRANSSYYVSAVTGDLLERRNDTWRWWDFFWMLHNMDYVDRSSFNHPLIITAGIAMAWLAVTGFWLLFRTMWRHDFAWMRRRNQRVGMS